MEEKKAVYNFSAKQKEFAENVLDFHIANIMTVLESKNVDIETKKQLTQNLGKIKSLDRDYLETIEYKQTREISYGVIEELINTSDTLFLEMLQESLSVIAGILYKDKRYFTEKNYTEVFNDGTDIEKRFRGKEKANGLWYNAKNGMKIRKIEDNLGDFIVAVQTIAKDKLKEKFPELKKPENLRPNAQANCGCVIL